jgi:hypothetical protein
MRWEWHNYQLEYKLTTGQDIEILAAWDEWYLDYMQQRTIKTKDWIIEWATKGENYWQGRTEAHASTVKAVCELYRKRGDGLGGFNSHNYPVGTPTAPS